MLLAIVLIACVLARPLYATPLAALEVWLRLAAGDTGWALAFYAALVLNLVYVLARSNRSTPCLS